MAQRAAAALFCDRCREAPPSVMKGRWEGVLHCGRPGCGHQLRREASRRADELRATPDMWRRGTQPEQAALIAGRFIRHDGDDTFYTSHALCGGVRVNYLLTRESALFHKPAVEEKAPTPAPVTAAAAPPPAAAARRSLFVVKAPVVPKPSAKYSRARDEESAAPGKVTPVPSGGDTSVSHHATMPHSEDDDRDVPPAKRSRFIVRSAPLTAEAQAAKDRKLREEQERAAAAKRPPLSEALLATVPKDDTTSQEKATRFAAQMRANVEDGDLPCTVCAGDHPSKGGIYPYCLHKAAPDVPVMTQADIALWYGPVMVGSHQVSKAQCDAWNRNSAVIEDGAPCQQHLHEHHRKARADMNRHTLAIAGI
eukprot:Rhum_TRINITY_DN18836_c0_g1::Rhum_TRINITY_DN18836_c0_g1_i1::g.168439::m.168439